MSKGTKNFRATHPGRIQRSPCVAQTGDLAIGTEFVTKRGLKNALGLHSSRVIDSWVRKKMVSSYRLGHKTRLFRVHEVIEDLARFRVNAVGRKS